MNDWSVELPIEQEQKSSTDELSFVLKPSGNKGVGVFATHGIVAGTHLDLFPDGRTRKFTYEELAASPKLERFYRFFGTEGKRGISGPTHFGRMSIGWYMNHSDSPNAHHDADWEYHALRDIAPGEEITIDYREL